MYTVYPGLSACVSGFFGSEKPLIPSDLSLAEVFFTNPVRARYVRFVVQTFRGSLGWAVVVSSEDRPWRNPGAIQC